MRKVYTGEEWNLLIKKGKAEYNHARNVFMVRDNTEAWFDVSIVLKME